MPMSRTLPLPDLKEGERDVELFCSKCGRPFGTYRLTHPLFDGRQVLQVWPLKIPNGFHLFRGQGTPRDWKLFEPASRYDQDGRRLPATKAYFKVELAGETRSTSPIKYRWRCGCGRNEPCLTAEALETLVSTPARSYAI